MSPGPLICRGPTYEIRAHGAAVGGRTITCLRCHATSFHPQDVAQRYCARCHRFHPDTSGERPAEETPSCPSP